MSDPYPFCGLANPAPADKAAQPQQGNGNNAQRGLTTPLTPSPNKHQKDDKKSSNGTPTPTSSRRGVRKGRLIVNALINHSTIPPKLRRDKVPTAYHRMTIGRKIVIKALVDSGMSYRQIAAMENISLQTIHNVAHDNELLEIRPDILEKTKRSLAARAYVMADRSISKAAEDNRMERMNSYQLTVMGSIMIDKARLMDGLSTENVALQNVNEHVQKSVSELNDVKDMIVKRLRASGFEYSEISDGNSIKTVESNSV